MPLPTWICWLRHAVTTAFDHMSVGNCSLVAGVSARLVAGQKCIRLLSANARMQPVAPRLLCADGVQQEYILGELASACTAQNMLPVSLCKMM